MKRRKFLMSGLLASPAIVPVAAMGQGAPSTKDFHIYVGFEAGGGADAVARAIAVQLQRRTSRRVRIENRTGNSGALPGEAVRKGTPDGSEIALLSSTSLISRLAQKDFPYDPSKDLMPVMRAGNFSMAFATALDVDAQCFEDYLEWIKGAPENRRVAVSSNATFVQVFNMLLKRATGQAFDPVNYRGVVAILGDMRDGKIPATVNTLTSLLPAHRGRRARILMITADRRLAVAPDIPTAAELGYPRLDMIEWFAFFVAPRTPPEIVDELHRTLKLVMEDPETVGVLRPIGLDVQTSTPEELAALIVAHRREWEARMEYTGVNVDVGPH